MAKTSQNKKTNSQTTSDKNTTKNNRQVIKITTVKSQRIDGRHWTKTQ